uniref:Uncharacterized protein n=1 Tax=Solanum tuberosum TaxID=4113 RepID=M1DR46_SOLTU
MLAYNTDRGPQPKDRGSTKDRRSWSVNQMHTKNWLSYEPQCGLRSIVLSMDCSAHPRFHVKISKYGPPDLRRGSAVRRSVDDPSSAIFVSTTDATSTGDAQDPLGIRVDPLHNATELNKWSIEGQYQIYADGKALNEYRKVARPITEEHQVLARSLHTFPPSMLCSSNTVLT